MGNSFKSYLWNHAVKGRNHILVLSNESIKNFNSKAWKGTKSDCESLDEQKIKDLVVDTENYFNDSFVFLGDENNLQEVTNQGDLIQLNMDQKKWEKIR